MIALDTNVLVYAHRAESPWHEVAAASLRKLAEGKDGWGIPWPCIHEFLAIVTPPRIFDPPTPLERALEQVEAWLESPTLTLLAESAGYWGQLRLALEGGKIRGPRVHDGRIAALCAHHGIQELWTADRDFSRFRDVKIRNPLLPSSKKSSSGKD